MSADSAKNGPVPSDQQLVIAQMQRQLLRYEEAMSSMGSERVDDELIDLREYWQVLVRRRWTVLLTIGALLLGTMISTALMTPVFRATTVVQIERESGKVLEYQNVTAEETVNAKDFYETQYELLQSRTLARRVIDQLGLRESGTLAAGSESGGFISAFLGNIKAMLAGERSVEDQLPPDLEYLFLENLTVQPVKNSRLVRLHYDSTDRREAALVVNTLAASFVDMSLERRFEASTYAKGFLEERIKQVRADLEDSERTLVDYAQSRGIINQDDRLGILTDKLREMNRALVAAEAQRFSAESQYQEMLAAGTDSLAEMLGSPVIQSLKRQRTDLEASYRENLKIYKPGYPVMQQLQEKISQVVAEIEREIGYIRDGIKVQYQAKLREEAKLEESINATQAEIVQLQDRSTDFQTLKREVDTNRELYDGLLQRMKEVGVAAGVSNNNISVVDRAEIPRQKYKPKLLTNMAIALGLGLFGGILLAFLFESLDDTIKSGADLEKILDKPVLGIIPRVTGKELPESGELALYSHYAPTSAFAEAYRSMRTALMFSTAEGAPRIMHFTSVNAGEGKTTTAVSTAINFTQTGGNVLMIDADLRNPSLHKLFRLPNHKGLTNYLSGKEKPADIAQATGVDGLFVIPSGPVPPNPAELLAGGKMVDLAALSVKRFDYVVIDSPPLLGLADALILADIAQTTLLVASANSTRTGAIEAGLKRLRHSRANILGTVLTKFDLNKANYGYDYHYSYSYGMSEDGLEKHSASGS
jgi:capsular exopolysaccharide synthesis family protein